MREAGLDHDHVYRQPRLPALDVRIRGRGTVRGSHIDASSQSDTGQPLMLPRGHADPIPMFASAAPPDSWSFEIAWPEHTRAASISDE